MADGGGERLPDFIVLGAPKAGTTTLFELLRQHPEVWVPERKEIHYFDQPAETRPDLGWYRAHFEGAPAHCKVGDLTPTYLARPHAPAVIAEVVPDVRLVAMLRHPVDRVQSEYEMQQSNFPSRWTLSDVVDAVLDGRPLVRPHFNYLETSRYVKHLRRVLEHFDREQLLVVLTDDLDADPAGVFAAVCRHIGVDARFRPPNVGARYNVTRQVRWKRLRRFFISRQLYRRLPGSVAARIDRLNERPGYTPLDPGLRRRLLDAFEADNAALAELLGRDLTMWSR